ncbi:uncharacterized protein ColSpa_05442 [Colletotrichum spaethianum]|uniref:Methyltransferase n=1 Tax=Colletotrichum spaethianum TaxID=700344 RepID=A0AA37P619_9PEZI|nr:uncharacterized protein ColSpa_05442 [Colletotrichum spaethianum]GKT45261.1 hypothetical protein ColSpa_05442 [Colletotrichum spaethianum]
MSWWNPMISMTTTHRWETWDPSSASFLDRKRKVLTVGTGRHVLNLKLEQLHSRLPQGEWSHIPQIPRWECVEEYHFPNDEEENERLGASLAKSRATGKKRARLMLPKDLQHHIFDLSFEGKLGLSPPNAPEAKVGRVLDLGTGTGIWAMDYGDDHPGAEVGVTMVMLPALI